MRAMHLFPAGAALLLAGCSALQIDVDVYKGPLINEPEIQSRQYSYLALSAHQLIEKMKFETEGVLQKCANVGVTSCDRTALQFANKFLNDLLEIYAGGFVLYQNNVRKSTQQRGIARLSQDLSDAYEDQLRKRRALEVALKDPTGSGKEDIAKVRRELDKAETELQIATEALNEALILFAQYILFVVNHQTLFADLNTGSEQLKSHRPILQSLANTLLVHANDLQRQAHRTSALRDRFLAEQTAVQRAFRISPPAAYDHLTMTLTLAADRSPPPSGATSPADPQATARDELKARQGLLSAAQQDVESYVKSMRGLVAAHRTLKGDVPGPLGEPSSPADRRAAEQDRAATAALYPAQPLVDAEKSTEGALAPMRAWFGREGLASVSTERQQRLVLALQYVEAKKDLLLSATGDAERRIDHLKSIQQRLASDVTLAQLNLKDLNDAVSSLQKDVEKRKASLGRNDKAKDQADKQAAKARGERDGAVQLRLILEQLRPEVLLSADAAKVTDIAGVHTLLRSRLANLKPPTIDPKFTTDDVKAAIAAVEQYKPQPLSVCGSEDACGGNKQIDVVDSLIAELRIKRVQALASGETAAAENLLQAINVAYEQRTAMIYLRPASDYLRSVHTATELQDGAEPQYRNMLSNWLNYLDPGIKKQADGGAEVRKQQLDKLNWQNINTVTVGGGGLTNFVLAKDDVGNWYVKAYSSDPKVIFESATSLALFNAGSRINTNLLQRYELEKQIGTTTDGAEKAALRDRLGNLNSQDGAPLLALRDRYAEQYGNSTRATGLKLYTRMTEAPAKVDESLAGVKLKSDNCKLFDLRSGLAPLDKATLDESRTQLGKLVNGLGINPTDKDLAPLEQAIYAGLVALNSYANKVYKALDDSPAADCETSRRSAAEAARDVPRGQALALARERRDTVERYESALDNIVEVATAK